MKQFENSLIPGIYLDLGGKKVGKRGNWEPKQDANSEWEYLNIDPDTQPDHLQSAEATGLPSNSYDAILVCELLEHVENPTMVLAEVKRLLVPGGLSFLSMPFLHQVHADPHDYERWTETKFRLELERAGLKVLEFRPMGSIFAVLHDLCSSAINRSEEISRRPVFFRLYRHALALVRPVFLQLDRRSRNIAFWITTGWAVTVKA